MPEKLNYLLENYIIIMIKVDKTDYMEIIAKAKLQTV